MRFRKFLATALLGLIILPAVTFAADVRFKDEQVTIPKSETINDDLYVGGGNVNVEGTVNGDVIVFGGQTRIAGKIQNSLFVLGGQVTIDGEVGNTIRVAGGNITISGKVNRDLLVAGGNVEISQNAEIKNDVKAASGQLLIAGSTGSVQAGVGTLTLASTAKINGNVTYTSENEASIGGDTKITGKIQRIEPPQKKKGMNVFMPTAGMAFSILSTILVALLFLFFSPKKSETITKSFKEKFGPNLLKGFLFLIAVPVLAVLLFITVLGIPLAVGSIFIYVILLYLGKIAGVISLGNILQNLGKKEKEVNANWIFVILAIILYNFLKLIPILGWFAVAVIFLTGLGSLISFDWDLFTKLKKDKTI